VGLGSERGGHAARWLTPSPRRVVVPDRLLSFLDEPASLTVLQAPLGFGKSTLATLWAETRGVDGDVVTVDVTGSTSLWSQVVAALDPVATTRAAGTVQVRALLARRHHATTLVLDRLDLALDEVLVDELLELLDAVPRLSVVACVHEPVVVGPPGVPDLVGLLLARGGRLLGPSALVLTVEEVQEVLAASGLPRDHARAVDLHASVGGWPMLARRTAAALVDGTGGVGDQAIVARVADEFVQHELLPTMPEESATALCLLALPHRPTVAAAATALGVGAREADRLLRRLAGWGLVRPEVVDGERQYRWPSALAGALRGAVRETSYDAARAADERLARWHLGRREWRAAFEHAHAAGDRDLVGAVLDQAWLPLIVYDIEVLTDFFREAPAEWFDDRPFVHGVRDLTLRLPRDPRADVVRFPDDADEVARRAADPDVRAQLNLGLVELFGLRRAGRHAEGLELARGLQSLAIATRAVGPADVSDLLAPIFLLTGILHELAGDPASAVIPLEWGVRTGAESTLRGSLRHCTSHLAMDYALLGDGAAASAWLTRAAQTPEVSGWVRPRADIAVDVAQVLLAVDRLDHESARTSLRRLLTASDPFDEMWTYMLYARAQYALLWGDRVAVVQHVLGERATRPGWSAAGSPLDGLLRAAEVDLLLALGHRKQAAEALRGVGQDHPLLDAPRARLALLSGQYDAALAIARESLLSRPSVARAREDLALVEVVARHRTGDTERARDDLERILEEGDTSLRAFVLMPGDDLRQVAADLPAARPVLDALDAAAVRPVFPSTLAPVRLTRREQVILAHLAAGLGREEIARRLSVSSHTVKSQTHSIYRKLGVRSRAEALTAAREQGVLRTTAKDELCG
jgi:LuxR family maltose regulon positive regulatory protein